MVISYAAIYNHPSLLSNINSKIIYIVQPISQHIKKVFYTFLTKLLKSLN